LGPHDFLKNRQWSLEEFILAFPEDELNHIKKLTFSGLYGEPTTCRDLSEIVKYVKEVSPKIKMDITSNGSTRTPEWWYNLGLIGGKNLRVQFDVDGTDQVMHSTYRRNTNLEKILQNMDAFSAANPEHTDVFTVVYKHNEPHLQEIKELTKRHGAGHWDQIESGRFYQERGAVYEYVDNKGNPHSLVQIDKDMPSWIPHIRRIRNFRIEDKVYSDDTHEVVCAAGSTSRLQIDHNGNVWPCCYLITETDHKNNGSEHLQQLRNSGEMNLFNYSLGDILKKHWYTEGLSSSLSLCSTANKACVRWCGKKKSSPEDKFD
jgi:MoaA/NifB/PqqE/SkfB family radical SAM enzyme